MTYLVAFDFPWVLIKALLDAYDVQLSVVDDVRTGFSKFSSVVAMKQWNSLDDFHKSFIWTKRWPRKHLTRFLSKKERHCIWKEASTSLIADGLNRKSIESQWIKTIILIANMGGYPTSTRNSYLSEETNLHNCYHRCELRYKQYVLYLLYLAIWKQISEK